MTQSAASRGAAAGGLGAHDAAPPVVTLTRLQRARELLRAKGATTQAGFTSERIPNWLLPRRPILFDDGPAHADHRKQLVRFFSPAALERHREFIERTARTVVAEAVERGSCSMEQLALHFSVRVASEIVGLTESATPDLARRLEGFFRQPPVDHTRPDYGRTTPQWIQAARNALGPLISLYWHDVRPAVRARKAAPRDDIISHLLAEGYRPREILMECLTYGTAGMVTTREFMSLTLLRLTDDADARSAYVEADAEERIAMLSEIIRLDPPVAHLYRRVAQEAPGCPYPAGALVDIDVRATNRDPDTYGVEADKRCPARGLRAADRTGLSFGDGAHRCPGSHLALRETDALMRALLAHDPRVAQPPRHEFDTLVQGYQLRDFIVTFGVAPAAAAP